MLNTNDKVSLREVLGDDQGLGYMAKYLDCHGALSLQVHPDQGTGEFLEKHNFQVRDKAGKEESFFVLKKAPGRSVHLFLGFDREALRPLAEKIRPRLEMAFESEQVSEDELVEIWKDLCGGIKKLCLDGIADGLFVHDSTYPASRECLALKVFCRPAETEQKIILNVLKYHMGVSGPDTTWRGPALLGKEYLLAAVALVNLIRKLEQFVKDVAKEMQKAAMQKAREEKKAEEKRRGGILEAGKRPIWIGVSGCNAGFERKTPEASTAKVLFYPAEIRADDCWIRIRPGILHAWQGGGNFLIELGHRSDNTFRILDYGREISDHPREMHYEEAMYALNDKGFFNDQMVKQLIVASQPGESPCHDLLSCQVYSASDKPFSIKRQGKWSFLMNPDGDMSLIARDSNGLFRCRMSVRRCRTVLIKKDMQVEVQPEQPNNRILHFFEAEGASPLL